MGSLSYVHNKQYAVWLQLGCVQGLHLVMRIWTFPKREVRKGRREGKSMVRYNEDAEVVARIKEGLKKKNGYCPCRLEMTEDNNACAKNFGNRLQILISKAIAIACYITKPKIDKGYILSKCFTV